MSGRTLPVRRALLLAVFCWVAGTCAANAQVFTLPTSSGKFAGGLTSLGSVAAGQFDSHAFLINSQNPNTTPLQAPSGSVSKLDLKSPSKARREFEKGYQFDAKGFGSRNRAPGEIDRHLSEFCRSA
jgi:hypothetical protein